MGTIVAFEGFVTDLAGRCPEETNGTATATAPCRATPGDDLSERERIARRLADSEARYHALLEALPTAAYACDTQGRPSRLIGLSQDITVRRQVEEDLRRTNDRLRQLLEALPVGVSIAEDPECRVITTNPAMARMFETSPGANISASAWQPLPHRYFHRGREL